MFTKQQIRALLLPLMAEQLLNALIGTADTIMVTTVGSAAISAVSLVDSINVLALYLFAALATGGTILCSQYLGRGQTKEANAVGRQLIVAVTLLTLVVTALCVALRVPLLRLVFGQVEPDVMENALLYFLITACSYPFIALYDAGAALFRSGGNSRLPMALSMLSNLLNIAGNAVLIFGFHLGVAGAALATLLSRAFCAVTILLFLRLPRQAIVVRDYRAIRPDFPVIWRILSVGIPTGVENGMFQFGKIALQSTVSAMGTTAIAAHAIASMMESIPSNAPLGIGLGMTTIVGQCIGAGKPEEARKSIRDITFFSFCVVAVSCLIVALLARPITVISNMEPEAAELALNLTYLICIVKPIPWTLSFIPAYGMRGAGDVRFSMLVSTVTMWVCRVAVTLLLVHLFHMGPLAVWLGMFTDWTVRAVIFSVRYCSGRWLDHDVLKN